MASSLPTKQKRGEALRRAVIDATMERIEREGIDQVRISDVAQAAGVHETSIYRRWRTLPQLLLDALLSQVDERISIPDTGDVERDLTTFVESLVAFCRSPIGAGLVRSSSLADDPDVATARAGFWEVRMAASEEIVRRGIAAGRLRPDTDPRLVIAMLGGVVHLYVTQFEGEMPDTLAERAVSVVLRGVAR
ncbi:TetR/AcrR family transcriptional regulator [Microbacterium resistens]|uniref:TetR/AcrR family transcriptional regulator n=1 Tax=Microbacterium resistens TaxID=156977 RepID=A0ABY3RX08_9MICO|nr:TetR/AcrR family transcriptional regulator [Microbacterium resistens]UGS27221.1 TetR/AcrR family transcriptional regulator [Microbacterium resistens]